MQDSITGGAESVNPHIAGLSYVSDSDYIK